RVRANSPTYSKRDQTIIRVTLNPQRIQEGRVSYLTSGDRGNEVSSRRPPVGSRQGDNADNSSTERIGARKCSHGNQPAHAVTNQNKLRRNCIAQANNQCCKVVTRRIY